MRSGGIALASLAHLTLGGGDRPAQILCLGAHCDDIEIGCGATLVELASRLPGASIHACVFCSDAEREKESRNGIRSLFGDSVSLSMRFGGLRDGFLPYDGSAAKEFLIASTRELQTDLVITHYRGDLHQDHRLVADVTYQVVRSGLVLEMEIPKYDGDLGRPNVYFPVSKDAAEKKIDTIMTSYPTQSGKRWFTEDTFRSLMRLRGIECKSESDLAEAFHSSKIIVA